MFQLFFGQQSSNLQIKKVNIQFNWQLSFTTWEVLHNKTSVLFQQPRPEWLTNHSRLDIIPSKVQGNQWRLLRVQVIKSPSFSPRSSTKRPVTDNIHESGRKKRPFHRQGSTRGTCHFVCSLKMKRSHTHFGKPDDVARTLGWPYLPAPPNTWLDKSISESDSGWWLACNIKPSKGKCVHPF